jgi:hypothetical protein
MPDMATTDRRTKQGPREGSKAKLSGWLVLVYRVPTEPSAARVSVWRDLKRLGALYLQNAACILPDRKDLRGSMEKVRSRIDELGGTCTYFEVPSLPGDQDARMMESFRSLAAKEYAEIVEECETKFVKEIEFERFRENYTFEEAEEIRQDLEKIRRWMTKVEARDWFGGPGRDEARTWMDRCEELLEAFEVDVYKWTEGRDEPSPGTA